MDVDWFNENVKPFLKECSMEYSSFSGGDFGDLERIEVEGSGKLGTVEFWSKGWVGVDVYDLEIEDQVMNVLLSPEEKNSIHNVFERFISIFIKRI